MDERTVDKVLDCGFRGLPALERVARRGRFLGGVVGPDGREVPVCGLLERRNGEMRQRVLESDWARGSERLGQWGTANSTSRGSGSAASLGNARIGPTEGSA